MIIPIGYWMSTHYPFLVFIMIALSLLLLIFVKFFIFRCSFSVLISTTDVYIFVTILFVTYHYSFSLW